MRRLPRLVVLDMAGTTIADGDLVADAFQSAFAAVGWQSNRDAIRQRMGMDKPQAIREVLQLIYPDLAQTQQDQAVAAILGHFQAILVAKYNEPGSVRPLPGVVDALHRLRLHGIVACLNTGFNRTIANAILEQTGWLESGLIRETVTSDEVPRGRPDPAMIDHLRHQLGGIERRDVAKIGDTPLDLEEGKQAQCGWVYGVTCGSHLAEELAICSWAKIVADVPAAIEDILDAV